MGYVYSLCLDGKDEVHEVRNIDQNACQEEVFVVTSNHYSPFEEEPLRPLPQLILPDPLTQCLRLLCLFFVQVRPRL